MIKKITAFLLCLVLFNMQISVLAEDFEFDIYDSYTAENDEVMLMELETAVYEEFEKRVITAWGIFSNGEVDIEDLKITKSNIVSLYSQVFYENPYYFYVKKSFSAKDSDGDGYYNYVKVKYICADEEKGIPTEEEIEGFKKTLAEIDKATEEILLYISPEMTDFEKVMTVHDYMVNNYVYDIEDTDQTMLIVLDKRGVCAAYSEAFQHMMNVLGIESTLVTSDEMEHIWNMVKVDGRRYHIDVTWDDVVPDQFAMVNHQYAFLSENAIKEMGHSGFDAPYYAGSTIYNEADWRDDGGAIVAIDGVMYRVEGNDLIDENDTVIYETLDGGDGFWNIAEKSGFANEVFAGLCEINGVLYFNTDTGIYSYDPETGETECILSEYGICGLYADKNMIVYNCYDSEQSQFVKKGEIKICDVRLNGPYYEDGNVVVRLYNDCGVPLWIISKGDGYMVQKVDAKSIGTATFANGSEQTIYIWKDSLEPVVEPFTVSE